MTYYVLSGTLNHTHSLTRTYVQEVFADIKDDDDDEFEVVPLQSTKTSDDISDGLCCCINCVCEVIVHFWLIIVSLCCLCCMAATVFTQTSVVISEILCIGLCTLKTVLCLVSAVSHIYTAHRGALVVVALWSRSTKIHCNLIIMLMMGTKQKEHYNEIGLPLVGYSAHSTGRSCDTQNNCNMFHTACCIRSITSVV